MAMVVIESPQSFIVAEECRKLAWQNGYRRSLGEREGWAGYGSTTAQGAIHLAAATASGPWYLAIDHHGIVQELSLLPMDMAGPGRARYAFDALDQLYFVMPRIYQLGVSLPDAPLDAFQAATDGLPKATEAERLVVLRIGQDIFRDRLLAYWGGCCPLTGIADRALLRASHIVPWSVCGSDAERLDVHNGLLLSALWDAAFDQGLVTFDQEGRPQFSPLLSDAACAELRWHHPIALTDKHEQRLAWHRINQFKTGS